MILQSYFTLPRNKYSTGLILTWILVGSLALAPETRGGVLAPGFSGIQHNQEGRARERLRHRGTVQEGYPYAGVPPVWPISVSSKTPHSGSKGPRDPFAPIRKTTPVPEPPSPPKVIKPAVPAPPVPGKLLSVVRGPWGYQAVIQLSPKDLLIVEPGEPVATTGWRVKEIKEDRVRLELIRSLTSADGSKTIKTANLFFK